MKRCKWCGEFVKGDMPMFTWYRNWPASEPLGWTEPQLLCPSDALAACNWRTVHGGVFAEVGVEHDAA
jgi:hypothetical protein